MQLFYAPDLDTDTGTYLFTEGSPNIVYGFYG